VKLTLVKCELPESLSEVIALLAGSAEEALRQDASFQFLVTCKKGEEWKLEPANVQQGQQHYARLVRRLAQQPDFEWAAYTVDAWGAPDLSTRPSEHPQRYDVVTIILAVRWGTFRARVAYHRADDRFDPWKLELIEGKPIHVDEAKRLGIKLVTAH